MASVYSADGGRFGTVNVKGDVEFGLVYNLHTGSLELAIKQCKDLAAVDTKRNRSDPYVFLVYDRDRFGSIIASITLIGRVFMSSELQPNYKSMIIKLNHFS